MTKQELFNTLKAPKLSDKILLLTHTDMDAAGAIIVIKDIFDNVDTKLCSNKTMDYDIRNTIMNNELMDEYDIVIACDISCSARTAEIIDKNRNISKFVLLDHHESAKYLNNYKWARVQPELLSDSYRKTDYYLDHDGLSSGASLMFDYLDYNQFTKYCSRISFTKLLIHMIACYDTWDWSTVFDNDERMNDLDMLCDLYGIEYFVKTMLQKISTHNGDIFNEIDRTLISIEKEKIANYVARSEYGFKTGSLCIDGKYYSIVTSYAKDYMQAIFARMKELHPKCDLYFVHYGTGISIRTDTDLNVAQFAMNYGGGGHPGAGGIKISQELLQNQLEAALNGTVYYD